MMPDGSGTPNPGTITTFADGLGGGAVSLVTGPGGDLFYVDHDLGRIRRIQYFGTNQPPTAIATADVTNGPAPLAVQFDGSQSTDPEGAPLTFAWDLDGNGVYDDSTAAMPAYTSTSPGTYTVRLRVTDSTGTSATDTLTISVDNTPPVATIASPQASLTWKVGDVIAFSGSASDAQQGTLPASALTWTLILQHCPSNCHQHTIQTFVGVASGSFLAPDHDYPSYLELRLTATDAGGLTETKSVSLQPKTVALTFASNPTGLQIAVNEATAASPFTRTVIVGSSNSVSAPAPQTLGGTTYGFKSWSDGRAQSHTLVAPATATTYVATYVTGLTLSINNKSVVEGDRGTVSAVFTVSLSQSSTQTVTVHYATAGGTATSGVDFTAVSGTLTFPPGATSRTITVPVKGEHRKEDNETFFVNLGTSVNAGIADGQGMGTILDDDRN